MMTTRLILSLAAVTLLAACSKPAEKAPEAPPAAADSAPAAAPAPDAAPAVAPAAPAAPTFTMPTDTQSTKSGLKYKVEDEGTGAQAQAGQKVWVHYTGWLTNGTKFDSSRDRGQPIDFMLGKGEVIPGWDEGVSMMKVGGKRWLVIPPELGYGAEGSDPVIPPNSTLVFHVELVRAE